MDKGSMHTVEAVVYFPERNKTDAHIQIFVERGKSQYNVEMLHPHTVDGQAFSNAPRMRKDRPTSDCLHAL